MEDVPESSWLQEYPVTLMQFLLFLYHNQQDFVPLCMTGDFLCGLAATLFPYRFTADIDSEIASPIEEFKVCLQCIIVDIVNIQVVDNFKNTCESDLSWTINDLQSRNVCCCSHSLVLKRWYLSKHKKRVLEVSTCFALFPFLTS